MYPFWNTVVLPALRASGAKKVVEIGALRGETTSKLIRDLGADSQVHVIDPVPDFDPSAHEAEFPGQYVFHRALSLEVLDAIPPMDAALIDGDHNWYTVVNECRALARVSDAAGQHLPLMILHDVCWPYGRRDLYYDPSNVPAEHRRPYEVAGINRANNKLTPGGGFNKTLANAVDYGGERNGVMTGLEDFLAEFDRPYRMVLLPIYYGLAIVAEQALLDERPELVALLDQLESNEGKDDIIALSEDIRLDAANLEQNFIAEYLRRIGVLSGDYLAMVKSSLVNDLHLEQELRIEYLLRAHKTGEPLDPVLLNDPIRNMRPATRRLTARHRAGGSSPDDGAGIGDHGPFTTIGSYALDHLHDVLDAAVAAKRTGDLVSVGVERGGVGIFMRAHADANFVDGTSVWLADRFTSATPGDLNSVRNAFERHGLLDDRVKFLIGDPAESLPTSAIESISVLHIGAVDHDDLQASLDQLHGRIQAGGTVVITTDGNADREQWLRSYANDHGGEGFTHPDHRTVLWTRSATPADAGATASAPATSAGAGHTPPLAERSATCDLSVVVVFYDMQREAPRTLRALSRSYQRDIEDLDYEVIVVENGSPEGRKVDRDLVESHGPEFRYFDYGEHATSSPVNGLNFGIEQAGGEMIALMIDGAHLLSPGVLHHAMVAARAYAPAMVTTQGWYLGPGQQSETLAKGYDQDTEDRLLASIEWPTDGYRLFDIGHFQADRDWFDGMWESNCLFVPRETLARSGGFDNSFDEAGGGYANLELYERCGADPNVRHVSLLGEGSFHQVHGGTTNNQPSPETRFGRIAEYARHYEEMRGRPFTGPRTLIHYVGTIDTPTRRSKARSLAAPQYFRDASPDDPGQLPTEPQPIPDALHHDYLDAYWRSHGWKQTEWMGHRFDSTADDLMTYQRLLHDHPVEWVIDMTDGPRGRALYLASLCDLLGRGTVVSITTHGDQAHLDHPRVRNMTAERLTDQHLVDKVAETVPPASALVIFGSARNKQYVMDSFDLYSPYVSVGGHAVLEWTAANGNPLYANHGPGPLEAVKAMRRSHPNFIQDPTVEAAGPSFHRGGYLKRTR